MIQLNILSGKMAGTSWVARRFPVRIGRAAGLELQLEETGIWDQHLLLEPDFKRGFLLKAQPQALARVNGQNVQEALLRNGDVIELGSVKLQFWLGRARPSGLWWREAVAWAAIVGVTFGQVLLLYWLLR